MLRVALTFYSFLYSLGLLFYLPVHVWRAFLSRRRTGQLLARLRPPQGPGSAPAIWVHAVSVGEVQAVSPLVRKLLGKCRIFLSTVTPTGRAQARQLFGNSVHLFYFPLDWQWLCRRFLRRLRPRCVLLAETELWPGFLAAARSLQVPVLLINGRVSDSSFRRYHRVRFFLAPLLGSLAHLCVQSREDKERILRLGAPPERVHQVGNLKYDYQLPEDPGREAVAQALAAHLCPQERDLLWICASTHPGEEELVAAVFTSLRREFPRLRMLLAPRHPHRAPVVLALLRERGVAAQLRSSLPLPQGPLPPPTPVVVLDSIGELNYLYRHADVVFVGGSLVPSGGHNILEPAYFAKPILVGTHMENFREIAATFREAYAVIQVADARELEERLRGLLVDETARQWLGRNARKVIRDNQGALRRTLEIVREYLPEDLHGGNRAP